MECSNESVAFCSDLTIEKFVAKHLELLDLERDAEIEENKCLQECRSVKSLEKKGVCIPKVSIGSTSTGLFGRSLLSFESYWQKGPLPSHTISSGDIVGVGNVSSDGRIEVITSGIVTRVSDLAVSIAFEKNSNFSDLEHDSQYAIIKLANDVTYKRLKRVLKTLETKGRDSPLVDVLFGAKPPSTLNDIPLDNLSFQNHDLNEAQQDAVRFALQQKEVAIIHGPPGTGKTTTVVECILQAVAQKLKVLACAPSNVAVDNLVEKLSRYKVKQVRLGHPARFLTSIQQYSLDAIISRYDGSNVVEELHKEIDELRERINKTKGSNVRRSMWAENRSLLKEVKAREKLIVKHVLAHADVVLCTLTSGSDDGPLKYLEKDNFDICFIDECSQATEAACWIPLVKVKRCIIAGDHHQLPPTIVSKKAARDGLEQTLMERLLKLHGDGIKKMLTIQYRMNEVIMQWPSDQLYEGKLQAAPLVRSHLLEDLEGVESNADTSIPLLLIDTNGYGLQELQVEDDESKGNEGEADLVAAHVHNLIRSGVRPTGIAVVTPYNLQVEMIKSRLSATYPSLEIKSVDGFQGREKEAVVLSLVRSNDIGDVGFLSEDRRINVAITRAKRHLAVICDSKTVSYHGFLKSFISYCEEKGEVRTAFEYESDIGHHPARKQTVVAGFTKKEKGKVQKESYQTKKKQSPQPQFSKSDTKKNNYLKVEDKRCIEDKYAKIIQEFVESKNTSIQFSTSLTAFERRTVHEIAENLGLMHISTGEGADRCIEVRKHSSENLKSAPESLSTTTQAKKNKNVNSQNNEIHTTSSVNSLSGSKVSSMPSAHSKNSSIAQSEFKDEKSDPMNVHSVPIFNNVSSIQSASSGDLSSQCGLTPSINLSNFIIPSVNNVSLSGESSAQSFSGIKQNKQSVKSSNAKTKKAPKSKLKVLKLEEPKEGEDDFESLIEQVVKSDKTCRFEKCKKSVATLSQTCSFCTGRFCFSHFMPEIHGCGDAVRAHARAQIRKEGVLHAGSGRPEKKTDPIKQSYLQKKLDKKLNEFSDKRKTQKKS